MLVFPAISGNIAHVTKDFLFFKKERQACPQITSLDMILPSLNLPGTDLPNLHRVQQSHHRLSQFSLPLPFGLHQKT